MDPHGTPRTPTSTAWVASTVATSVAVGLLVLAARRAGPAGRAGGYAAATAILWAFEATFIKSATQILLASGVGGLLTSWLLYALIVAGVGGLTTEQLALREGPLRVSQPLIVIVDPLVSVLYGVSLFHERLRVSGAALTVIGLCAAVTVVGVVVMTAAVPETLVPGTGLGSRQVPEAPRG
jgi:hypothetical protein